MPELKDLFKEEKVEIGGVTYRMKRLSHGEATEVFKGLTTFDAATGQVNVDADAIGRKRLASCIVSWDLTKDGQPLPVNEETIGLIPEDHANRLLEVMRLRLSVRPDLEKK